jgi:hypothetical protein
VQLEAVDANPDESRWSHSEVVYDSQRQPFVAEADSGELLQEEIEEFSEFLEDVADSPGATKVREHLAQSKAVVAVQLLGDVDDVALTAAGTFLAYFAQNCGGMVQADGEGFYEGDTLLVELE